MGEALDFIKKQGMMPNTIFDVGVANGTFDLYETFPDSRFVLIEPLEEFSNKMLSLKNKYNVEIVNAAASNVEGITTFNVHDDLVGSSLLNEVEGEFVDGAKRTVPTIRIDQLVKERELPPPFLIKVDVQGAELMVIEGSEAVLDKTDVIILEVSLFGFFVGGPQFFDVITYMKEKGFVVYDMFDGRNRLIDNALAQVDIMFVKENGILRRVHSYADIEQRVRQNAKLQKRNQ